MTDVIEELESDDRVVKMSYHTVDSEVGEVHIEMWHDIESLHEIAEKSLFVDMSTKALREYAKEHALAVRRTKVRSAMKYVNPLGE